MSKHVLNLFGEFYLQATAILLIMMISQLFNALTGTVPFLLQMTGYERIHKNNLFIVTAFSVPFGNTFDNEFWDNGAAMLFAFVIVTPNLLSVIAAKKHLNLQVLKVF